MAYKIRLVKLTLFGGQRVDSTMEGDIIICQDCGTEMKIGEEERNSSMVECVKCGARYGILL